MGDGGDASRAGHVIDRGEWVQVAGHTRKGNGMSVVRGCACGGYGHLLQPGDCLQGALDGGPRGAVEYVLGGAGDAVLVDPLHSVGTARGRAGDGETLNLGQRDPDRGAWRAHLDHPVIRGVCHGGEIEIPVRQEGIRGGARRDLSIEIGRAHV